MIIIIETDQTLQNMLQINISSKLPMKIMPKDNASEAIALMEILPDTRIVICRAKTGKEETATRIINEIKTEKYDCKVIVLEQTGQPPEEFVTYLASTSPVDIVTKTVISLINKDGTEKAPPMVQRSYFTIPFSLLKLIEKFPCDFYLKIKKGNLNDYLKVFKLNDDVDFAKIDSYIVKGAKKAYVKKEDGKKAVDEINSRFKKILSHSLEDCPDQAKVESVILENLEFLGLNKAVLQIANSSISKINQELKTSKSLGAVINSIYKTPGSLRYRKSFMTAVFCQIIASKESYIDSHMMNSLQVACFFNDYSLQNESLISIRSNEEFNMSLLSKEDGKDVDTHASRANEILSKIKEIPEETLKIIKQHHGVASGQGFSQSLNAQIGILTKIFITAEEVALRIINSPSPSIKLNAIFEEISNSYNTQLDEFLGHIRESFTAQAD